MSHQNKTVDELKAELSANGVNITTKAFLAREKQAQREAKEYASNNFSSDKGNLKAKQFVQWALNAGTVVGMALVVGIFAIILIGLFIVETLAVVHALQTLLPTYEAVLLGIVLVGSLYTVLFVQQLLISNRMDKAQWSFRLWLRDFRYTLGIGTRGKAWAEKYKEYDPYADSVMVLRFLVFSVISLSTIGRLGNILMQVGDVPAREGLDFLIYETSLNEWFSVIFVGFATFSIILASHFTFTFLYKNFTRITGGGIDLTRAPKSYEDLEIEYMQNHYRTLLIHTENKYLPTNTE